MLYSWGLWLVAGMVLGAAAWIVFPRRRANGRLILVQKFFFALVALLTLATISIGTYLGIWYSAHSRTIDRELYKGVRHARLALSDPRRAVVNIITVSLKTADLEFIVTPSDPDVRPKLRAKTVEAFCQEQKVQVAMNANFFHPFHSNSPWNYYPQTGDMVELLGIAASKGDLYSGHQWGGASVFFSQDNRVHFGRSVEITWNAIAGDQWLVQNGKVVATEDQFGPYPRAGIALNAIGDELLLAVVDGKQPGFSEGLTVPEFANLLKSRGAFNAINLDGGGSVTLISEMSDGRLEILNSPIHTRIPGRQRPVGNHIGIRAGAR